MSGNPRTCFQAFADLAQLLLSRTVLGSGQFVRLSRSAASTRVQTLGGLGGPTTPVQLRNDFWLRVAVTLRLDDTDAGRRLKVLKSSFQYQADEGGLEEIFRYDYLREPGPDPHPQSHLNLHGDLHVARALPRGRPLQRVHFPTARVSLEAVIRLLIEQFEVPSATPAEAWRPLLAQSEADFREIAHQPPSGPAE